MTQPFANALDKLGPVEGGYVDDPADSGGATNHGVTQALARQYGYKGHMRDYPKAEARRVYYLHFWQPLHLEAAVKIGGDELGYELFEQAVNMGKARAAQHLQRLLNALNQNGTLYPDLAVDGLVGQITLGALLDLYQRRRQEGMKVLVKGLNCLQGAFYIELAERREKDERFLYGWLSQRV